MAVEGGAVQTSGGSSPADSRAAGTTRGHRPPRGALNSGRGRAAPGGQPEPAPRSLARTPLSPAAESACGRALPSPGRGRSECGPYRWLLSQIAFRGSQPPFSPRTQLDEGHSRVPAAFRWAGRELLGQFPAGAAPHSRGTLLKPLGSRYRPLPRARPTRQAALPWVPSGARALDPRRGGARGGGGSASHVGADAGCSATPA